MALAVRLFLPEPNPSNREGMTGLRHVGLPRDRPPVATEGFYPALASLSAHGPRSMAAGSLKLSW